MDVEIRKIDVPKDAPRIETGVVQFGEDWPGYFIRGDNVLSLIGDIEWVEYVLDCAEKGEPIAHTTTTLMLARGAVEKIRKMRACIL